MISMAARVAAVLGSALLYIAAYPPSDQRWTAFVALVPFFLALRATSVRQSIALGLVWSFAMSYGVTSWLIGAVVRYFDQAWAVGVSMLAGTTLVGASIEYCAIALAHRILILRFSPTAAVALTASTWAAAELCRTRIGFGNPWGLFGYAIVGDGSETLWPALVQVADLGGVYAVTFVLVAINAALAEAWAAARRRELRATTMPLLVGLGVAMLAYGYGSMRLATVAGADGDPVPVAIVQANLDLGSQWREEMYGANLAEYLDLTDRVVHERRPRIRTVFWPENAMTFFVDEEPAYRAAIGRILAAYDVELVAGAPRFENRDDPRYFNSVFLFRPDGDIAARFDKRRLMPFAEYFPLSRIDLLRRSFGRVRTFEAAAPGEPLPTRAGKLGVIVCNEAIYPEDAAARAREGAEVLANLSNDSWVEGAEFAENQLRIATLRAIEQRRYLVRASTSGPSAIVEPTGRIVRRSDPHTLAVLTGEVRPRSDVSVYGRYGDAFAAACLVVTLAGLAVARRSRAIGP